MAAIVYTLGEILPLYIESRIATLVVIVGSGMIVYGGFVVLSGVLKMSMLKKIYARGNGK